MHKMIGLISSEPSNGLLLFLSKHFVILFDIYNLGRQQALIERNGFAHAFLHLCLVVAWLRAIHYFSADLIDISIQIIGWPLPIRYETSAYFPLFRIQNQLIKSTSTDVVGAQRPASLVQGTTKDFSIRIDLTMLINLDM